MNKYKIIISFSVSFILFGVIYLHGQKNKSGNKQAIDFYVNHAMSYSSSEKRDFDLCRTFLNKSKDIANDNNISLSPWHIKLARIYFNIKDYSEANTYYTKKYKSAPRNLKEIDYINYSQIINAYLGVDAAIELLTKKTTPRSLKIDEWVTKYQWAKENLNKIVAKTNTQEVFDANLQKLDVELSINNGSPFFSKDNKLRYLKPNKDDHKKIELVETTVENPTDFEVILSLPKSLSKIKDIFIDDNNKVYFSKLEIKRTKAFLRLYTGIYDPKRKKITRIKLAPFNDKESHNFSSFVTNDGKKLYFCSNRKNGFGGSDIYVVNKQSNGEWEKTPANLGPIVNSPYDELSPYLSGNDELYFSSNGHIGFGGQDIYFYDLSVGGSGAIVNISSKFNTHFDDVQFKLDKTLKKGIILYSGVKLPIDGVNPYYFYNYGTLNEEELNIRGLLNIDPVPVHKKDSIPLVVTPVVEVVEEIEEIEEILPEPISPNFITIPFHNSFEIPVNEQSTLNNFIETMDEGQAIIIMGFSSSGTTCQQNISHSLRRAKVVKDYIANQYKIPSSSVTVEYYGQYKKKILKETSNFNQVDLIKTSDKSSIILETYTVSQNNDNLWQISKRFNLDVFDLIALNCDDINIAIGDKIYVLVQDMYKVKPNDRWLDIAKNYTMPVESILKANNTSDDSPPEEGSNIYIPINSKIVLQEHLLIRKD